jgi:uncharacterized protein with ParB-like and HNH nuclease domain
MSFQTPITIADALGRISNRKLLLPAIQREFVWKAWQIEWLFDSLMQGYPFGSFLFWEIREDSAKNDYKYYEFITKYREYYATHNPSFNSTNHSDFDAVLDGQQRLTAIYIGLLGSYAFKLPRVRWADSEYAIPTRKLYLNILHRANDVVEEESGRKYEFRFLTDEDCRTEPDKWFLVGDILKVAKMSDFNRMIKDKGYSSDFAMDSLSELHSVVHQKQLINYYLVKDADLERALNVFVRVNAGGEKLSMSDMLMSTAIANWTEKNAREEIFGLVEKIKGKGFYIDKDLVLKTCLYLYSSDIRYKVSNFSAAQVKLFEQHWDDIAQSILVTFLLVRDFGFEDASLTSKNALLPIIYWVHHNKLTNEIATKTSCRADRIVIRRWLHSMLLKGIFGGSADTILSAIRRVFTTVATSKAEKFGKPYVRSALTSFPAQEIATVLKSQGKDPDISAEFIDSLLCTQYEEKRAFSVLALLAPNLDYKNGDFHKDHLHPASSFKTKRALKALGVSDKDLDFYQDPNNWNSILNLAHLDAPENMSKQNKPLKDWMTGEVKRLRSHQ